MKPRGPQLRRRRSSTFRQAIVILGRCVITNYLVSPPSIVEYCKVALEKEAVEAGNA